MTLLVDARPVDHPTARQRGIGRYVTGLLRGLVEIDAPVHALYGSDMEAEVLADAIPDLTLERWSPDVVRRYARPDTWYVATQLMLHPVPLDPIPRVITEAGLPVAAVMYDVIPYRFPEQYQVEPIARRQAQLRAPLARTCDALLAISQFAAVTAAEELDFPLDRIAMIGAGVEPQFAPSAVRPLPRADRVLPVDVDSYVVAVTGSDERKNTEGLVRGWGRLDPMVRDSHHLVIVTAHSPTELRRWEGWAAEAGISNRVVFTGTVDDDEMVSILQGARLAVMPSLEEGFGLPVVEAAACGIPVICSNFTSLPEVLDEPAACFDPRDPDAIAHAIARGLTDDAHHAVLLTAGEWATQRWTWPRVAQDLVDGLDRFGPRWPRPFRRPASRIVIAGPFAGSASGVGAYDERVLEAMRRATDREIVPFVDSSDSSTPTNDVSGTAVLDRWPARSLGRFRKPWEFDDVVAVVGGSPHHVASAEAARQSPAHLWIHEFGLLAAEFGSLFSAATAAKSLIVASEQAADGLRRAHPLGPPILVLPLANAAMSSGASPRTSEVVVWAWASGDAELEMVVRVAARLALSDPTASIGVIGEAYGASIDDARKLAERLNADANIVFEPFPTTEEALRRLSNARAGLHLRAHDSGQVSVAVAALLEVGVPTITNAKSHGPSSPGLQLVPFEVEAIADAIRPLLTDDSTWQTASEDARARAAGWTFDDVARELLRWLEDVDDIEPSTIRRVGPLLASPGPDG